MHLCCQLFWCRVWWIYSNILEYFLIFLVLFVAARNVWEFPLSRLDPLTQVPGVCHQLMPIKTSENQWKPIKINENQWIPMLTNYNQCTKWSTTIKYHQIPLNTIDSTNSEKRHSPKKRSFWLPKKWKFGPQKKVFPRIHLDMYILQKKNRSNLVYLGLWSLISNLQPPIGGHHPVLYFTTQITKKYSTAMC